ncbi:Multiple C2 and transmembrane domain-containing protein 2 [Portunus trituberculatus]|uniref:Multiple C2 and transmembrane domain-containing protein 2 n=1 Tax=Portunus trituberculatus TaxID=210409 RepID=A0A5B7DLE1_PORTR|nr:Multiple C2 and transmembrane domain-containing protein 2 [Portunus trituberculatus]
MTLASSSLEPCVLSRLGEGRQGAHGLHEGLKLHCTSQSHLHVSWVCLLHINLQLVVHQGIQEDITCQHSDHILTGHWVRPSHQCLYVMGQLGQHLAPLPCPLLQLGTIHLSLVVVPEVMTQCLSNVREGGTLRWREVAKNLDRWTPKSCGQLQGLLSLVPALCNCQQIKLGSIGLPGYLTVVFSRLVRLEAEERPRGRWQASRNPPRARCSNKATLPKHPLTGHGHPAISDVSVERQDSTTDYAADNSSAEQSSSGTPLTMSPRRGPHLASSRHYSNDPNTLFENGEDPTETESRIMEELPDELLASTEASLEPDTSGAPGESGDQGASIASNFSPPTPARAAHFSIDTASPSYLLGRGTESDTSQQLMLCEGESVTMDAPSPLQASSSTNTTICEVWSKEDPAVQRQRALRQHSFFQLHIHLKRGQDLVARDACGTSDPYVKFKVAGKLAYKSKTVYKDLNPTWDESFTVGIEDPFEPVSVKVRALEGSSIKVKLILVCDKAKD